MAKTLDELIDGAWEAMRPNMFRRAVLGKRRCAHLVMLACSEFPDSELRECRQSSAHAKSVEEQLAARVADRYRTGAYGSLDGTGSYGMVFLSVVLLWAASAIVQYLVIQWWQRHFDAAGMRAAYGWER